MDAPDTSGRVRWWARLRDHRWVSIERAGVIAAVAIVMSSLFVTTYSLALGDPVPRRIDAALVGDPRGDAGTVKAVQGVAENSLDFTHYESLAAARDAIDRQRESTPPSTSPRRGRRSMWRAPPAPPWRACWRRSPRSTRACG
jgi:hypothetical protein